MENIGTIINILIGLATLLSVNVCFWYFMKRVDVQGKKLDDLSSDIVEVRKLVHLVKLQDKKLDDLSKNIAELKHEMTSVKTLLMAKFNVFS